MSLTCQVCLVDSFKYKCPKCLIKYCSLSCFKTHTCISNAESVKKEDSLIESFVKENKDSKTREQDKENQSHLLSTTDISLLLNHPDIKSTLTSSKSISMAFHYIHGAQDEEESLSRLAQVMHENKEFASLSELILQTIDTNKENKK